MQGISICLRNSGGTIHTKTCPLPALPVRSMLLPVQFFPDAQAPLPEPCLRAQVPSSPLVPRSPHLLPFLALLDGQGGACSKEWLGSGRSPLETERIDGERLPAQREGSQRFEVVHAGLRETERPTDQQTKSRGNGVTSSGRGRHRRRLSVRNASIGNVSASTKTVIVAAPPNANRSQRNDARRGSR